MPDATVISVSPRYPLKDTARRTRERVARDGVARVGAITADTRQRRHLRRLAVLLAEDEGLTVTVGAGTDGCTYLTAFPVGQRPAAVWGDLNGADRPADVVLDV